MHSKSDAQLLREYAEHGTELAFTAIVTRHTNLVYSAAVRQLDSPDMATEITQRVFIGLARGARTLSPRLDEDASLAGWLCRSARNIALNLRRDEFRQHSRERQAMENISPMSETAPDWEHLRPVLDEAMSELSEPDYDALVMRFFNNQDLRSIGLAFGVTDNTAQKRVSRALDKLREHLSRRGIKSTAAALSIVLSTNAVQAAPAGLAVTISTAAALAGTTISTPTTIAATKIIAMTTLQKALITVTTAIVIGAGIYEARQQQKAPSLGLAVNTPAASGPVMEFDAREYNFGKVVAGDMVRHIYKVSNTGSGPLEITNIVPSCGCTTCRDYTRRIEPGGAGIISIQFNSAHKSGNIIKTLTIYSNAKNQPKQILFIKGLVAKANAPVAALGASITGVIAQQGNTVR
jgi:RNA polymerase sigma factor (sigma-70 family)